MTTFAFVFPGQGSQTVGMLDAWGDHPAVRDTLAEASPSVAATAGWSPQASSMPTDCEPWPGKTIANADMG